MKVLHLISSGGMYGAENVVAALARDLAQMGCATCLGVFDNAHRPQNIVADQFEARGLSVVRIPCRGRADRRTVQAIRETAQQEQVHIFHSHGYKADIYGYLACRRLNLPMVATRHSHLWTRQTAAIRLYEFLDALFLRRFDAVVAVSDPIADEARRAGIAAQKITTINNGIDASCFGSAWPSLAEEINKRDKLLIGTVGRLVSPKGIDSFLRAAREVVKQIPDTLFVIVGDGPDRGKLETLARGLGIGANVLFTGSRSDMPSVYASLDIFVLPSLSEGMPMVVLEAMASRKPVIATDVGAVSKLVIPGQTGMLVPAADTERLTQAMLLLAQDSNLRSRMGRAGEALVREQFSSRGMAPKYMAVYERLLEQKAGLRRFALTHSRA